MIFKSGGDVYKSDRDLDKSLPIFIYQREILIKLANVFDTLILGTNYPSWS